MTATAIRVAAGLVVFVAVALVAMAGLLVFSESTAVTSWALVTIVALPAGLAVYALVELRQTGRLDSLTRQLDTRTVILMPLAIALNIVLGQAVAAALKLPVYLDSIGTILVAALAGPLAGALTGLLSNLLWSYVVPPPFQSPYAAPFALTAVVVGLMAGSFARWGWLRPRPDSSGLRLVVGAVVAVSLIVLLALLAMAGYQAVMGATSVAPESDELLFLALGWLAIFLVAITSVGLLVLLAVRRDLTVAYVVVAGVLTGMVAAVISAPIAANLFGGVTGSGTDFLVAAFRQAGADLGAATLGQSLVSDPIDKVTTFFVVYLVLGAMAVRQKARFPQGEKLIEEARGSARESPGWPDDEPGWTDR